MMYIRCFYMYMLNNFIWFPFLTIVSEFYNNYEGFIAHQYKAEDSAQVIIQDVTSISNLYYGVYLTGTGITVRNAKVKNSESGLVIGSNFISRANNVTLAGDISITNNGVGLTTNTFPNQRSVRVTGDLNILRNDVGIE